MWHTPTAGPLPEQTCTLCGARSRRIAAHLGLCLECVRTRPQEALTVADSAHAAARRLFDLPERAPRTEAGRRCGLCVQGCVIGEEERGYCGLRRVREGRLRHLAGTPARGLLHWYRDPLPTNCVADWVCAGSRQHGKHNLAVFYASCTVDCLFCQNWHFRQTDPARSSSLTAIELADAADPRTYCVCYFGGDPASQMPHALAASRVLAERGVVVCWETNGTARPRLMNRALDLSLATGGCVKFDLKAYDEGLHQALTGASNRQTLENFARAATRFDERSAPPPVVASTLLVPGYVDADEVGRLAHFIAELNPAIPYALLGFAPHFLFPDLPRTSVRHAEEAEAAARAAGLRNVRVGNRHLLSRDY
ncbi:MAG: radical SAM protein [Gemmatimonadetes bacterium]|nr:radical SAM protein [Gemmatimonadota bacterium]